MIPVFYRLRSLPLVDSTNAEALRAAVAGEDAGLVVTAARQTAGRGRLGRVWESPEGNLFLSILLRPGCGADAAAFYGFAASLAVYDLVRTLRPAFDVALKWPNDVLAEGRKIAGILLETGGVTGGRVGALVVGVGVNVVSHPEGGLYPATSLGADVALEKVGEIFLQCFDFWRLKLEKEGFEPLRAIWQARAKKGALVVRDGFGGALEGEFVGLDGGGGLILRLADGVERVFTVGDVGVVG